MPGGRRSASTRRTRGRATAPRRSARACRTPNRPRARRGCRARTRRRARPRSSARRDPSQRRCRRRRPERTRARSTRARPRPRGRRSGSPRRPRSSSTARLQRALDLPLRVALGEVAALVAYVLAARERELDLRAAVLPVHARRNEREALLADAAVQRVDLAAVEEELARPVGLVVGVAPLVVRRDRGAVQPELAVAHVRVRLHERRAALTQRLHLAAGEDDARLEAVEQLVLVPRLAVLRDHLLALGHRTSVGRDLS